MKFIPVTETVLEKDQLNEQFKAGHEIGRVCLGEKVLFFKKQFKVCYIPYEDFYRAFRRVKCVPARICCGTGEIQLNYLVLCTKKNEELAEIDLPDEKAAAALLDEIQEKHPEIKIGKKD